MKPWRIYKFVGEDGKDIEGNIFSVETNTVHLDFWWPGSEEFLEYNFDLEEVNGSSRYDDVDIPNEFIRVGPDFPSKEAALQWIYENYFEYFL